MMIVLIACAAFLAFGVGMLLYSVVYGSDVDRAEMVAIADALLPTHTATRKW
jgi:alpha-D-ribose 1-methylphosphonate 5-triphosphate synthase subunit PhnG